LKFFLYQNISHESGVSRYRFHFSGIKAKKKYNVAIVALAQKTFAFGVNFF